MSNLPTDSQVSHSGSYQVMQSGAYPVMDRNKEGEYVVDTRVSYYEMVSSFLISSIVIVGMMVLLGFMIWMTMWDWGSSPVSVAMEELIGNEDRPEGVADDWQEPGVEEFPEVEQPQLADALEAMTDAVSSVKAQLEKYDGNALEMGTGTGLGDIRERGKGRGNARGVPETERWRIEYTAKTSQEYRSQLEFFDVDVGGLHQNVGRIELVRDLTRGRPTLDSTSRKAEKRMYFSHTQQRLKKWDQRILQDAGVRDVGKLLSVQFYEEPALQNFRQIEAEYFTKLGKQLLEVQRTYFKIRPRGNGFEFYVDKMEFRPMPTKG